MEAFSLLKYWRGGGGGGGVGGPSINVNGGDNVVRNCSGAALKTIKSNAAVSESNSNHNNNHVSETDEEEDSDDGPFFDLEFSLPDGNDEEGEYGDDKHGEINGGIDENGEVDEEDEDCDDSDEDDDELKFTLSSGSSGGESADRNISLSPSDDLFFKGRLVPVETTTSSSETNTKPQLPASSLLKSATRFRVMMLKLKRSKQNSVSGTSGESVSSSHLKEGEVQQKPEQQVGKSFTVKFKVEEVPIVSLFMRENSSKASKQKQNLEESVPDEKKFSKEAMQRYLKKVKPLYVRVSKRYVDKLKFSGQLSSAQKAVGSAQSPTVPEEKPPIPPASKTEKETQTSTQTALPLAADAPPHSSLAKAPKQGSLPTGLRIVCKHLGKSRSASSAVAAAPPGAISSKRRDDSLLQQQDGIQGAILHCKRSFKASREELEASAILARSASDTSSYGKSGKGGGEAQPCSGSASK